MAIVTLMIGSTAFVFILILTVVLYNDLRVVTNRPVSKKKWGNYYQEGVPLFSHWKCYNCDCWLSDTIYTAQTEDLGCPNCEVSLSSFVYVEVDRQKKYNEIMGFNDNEE